MIRMTDSIYIEAPVEKVFDYYKDPAHWEEIAPAWLHTEYTNITRKPQVKGTTFDTYGKVPGLPPMRGSAEFVDAEPNRRLVLRGDTGFGMETTTFLFEPAGSGMVLTVLDEREKLAAERVPLVGRIAEWVVDQLGVQWMHVLKAKMEDKKREDTKGEGKAHKPSV